jgi:hypothetical protein
LRDISNLGFSKWTAAGGPGQTLALKYAKVLYRISLALNKYGSRINHASAPVNGLS